MSNIQTISVYELEDHDEHLSSSESSDEEELQINLIKTSKVSSRHFLEQPRSDKDPRENIGIYKIDQDKSVICRGISLYPILDNIIDENDLAMPQNASIIENDDQTLCSKTSDKYQRGSFNETSNESDNTTKILTTSNLPIAQKLVVEVLRTSEHQIVIKEEPMDVDEISTVQSSIQNLAIKEEEEVILETDGSQCEFMDENEDFTINSISITDVVEKSKYVTEKSRNKFYENPSDSATFVSKLVGSLSIKNIEKKTTSARQVACKSTGFVPKIGQDIFKPLSNMNFTNSDEKNEDFSVTKIKDEPIDDFFNVGNLDQKTSTSVKNLRVFDCETELKIVQNVCLSSLNASRRSGRFGSLSSKPAYNFTNIPNDIFGVKIKEEKVDDEEIGIESRTFEEINLSNLSQMPLNQKIRIELDDYLAAGPSGLKKPSVTSNLEDDSIISTKVVSIPASNSNKTRKIIVIKKPLSAGMSRPANSQIVRKISLADFEKLGANKSIKKITRNSSSTKVIATESPNGSGAGKIRYTVKSVPQQPSRFVKFTKSSQSKLQISNISSAVNKQNTIYRCQKCHLLFTAHSEYIEHIKEHKSHIVFNEKRIIRLEDVQKMNQYQCAQCNAGFPTLEKLSMHENRHKTEFACKYCDKKFLFLYRYKEHMLLHEAKKEKYMECKHCDKKFLKKERYDEHMEMHFPKDIYPCGVCEKKFPSHAAAMEHMKIAHSKRLPMKCGLCNYETFVKQNFEKHASMHLRYVEKLNTNTFYKCDKCPQSFREPSVLKNHKDYMHAE